MKLGLIVNPEFQKAVEKVLSAPLPLKTAFKSKSIIKQINEAVANYNGLRMALIEEFGEKKEDGTINKNEEGYVKIIEEKFAEFEAKFKELNEIEVEVSLFKLEELGNISLSIQEVSALEGLIEA